MMAPELTQTLQAAQADDVLELDEMWSFVYQRANKHWLWIAICRRTRQVVAFFLGNRSEQSCQCLWDLVPPAYRNSTTYSDFWKTYAKVIQTGKHHCVGKETGQTAHVERFNNTVRQRLARYVRETLSFSKCKVNHFWFTYLFIVNYNLSLVN